MRSRSDADAQRARLDALEARFAARLRPALLHSVAPALAAFEQGASPALAAALVSAAPVLAVLRALYEQAGTAEARHAYRALTDGRKAQAPPGLVQTWGARLSAFLTGEGAAAVRGITRTTRRLVQAVLEEAARLGDGIPVAAAKLRARVEALAPTRAVAICRTELVAAGNYGSLLGAEATGLKLEKVWLSTSDGRTRIDHVAANGQRAPLQNGFFQVGGERCRYPGDPLLSPRERCRCRCAILYQEPDPA